MSKPAKLITKDFVFLVIAHFMQALGYSSMLLLPLYLKHLGASHAEIGTIMAAGSIGGLSMRPLIGWALDTVGRKRTLYLGTTITALAMVAFLSIDSLGVAIFVNRVFFGIGTGALFSGYFTLVSDIIPLERRTQGIALFGVSGLLPLVVNPISATLGVDPPSLRSYYPLLGVAVLLSIVPLALVREPKKKQPSTESKSKSPGRYQAMRTRPLVPVWMGILLLSGGVSTFMTFATVTAATREVPHPANLWYAYAAGAAIVRVFGGNVLDRLGAQRLYPAAMMAMVTAAIIAGSAQTSLGFLAAALAAGTGHGFGFPVLTSQLVNRVDPKFRGTGLAMFTALWEVGALCFAPAFGWLADATSDAVMFYSAAGTVALGVLVWWPLERGAVRSSD